MKKFWWVGIVLAAVVLTAGLLTYKVLANYNLAVSEQSLQTSNYIVPGWNDQVFAASREASDGIYFIQLQGNNDTLNECIVCHANQPPDRFQHPLLLNFKFFLPTTVKQ